MKRINVLVMTGNITIQLTKIIGDEGFKRHTQMVGTCEAWLIRFQWFHLSSSLFYLAQRPSS